MAALVSILLLQSASDRADDALLAALNTIRSGVYEGGPGYVNRLLASPSQFKESGFFAARLAGGALQIVGRPAVAPSPPDGLGTLFSEPVQKCPDPEPGLKASAQDSANQGPVLHSADIANQPYRIAVFDFCHPDLTNDGFAASIPDNIQIAIGEPKPSPGERHARQILTYSLVGVVALLAILEALQWVYRRKLSAAISQIDRALATAARGEVGAPIRPELAPTELRRLMTKIGDLQGRLASLIESLRMMGNVTAHELRTPLTRVQSYVMELKRLPPDGNEHLLIGDRISDQIDEILRLYDALLLISRTELERGENKELPRLALSSLVEEVCEVYEDEFLEAGFTFASTVEPGIWALGDRSLLFRAVSNLLENARKYAPSGASIGVTLRSPSASTWELAVTNSGGGFPKDILDNAFSCYTQSIENGKKSGLGLGLHLVAKIAGRHGASVWIEPNATVADVRIAGPKLDQG